MSCSSLAILARSAAVACSAWRCSAALRAASEAACLRVWTKTPASQNAISCSADNATAAWPPCSPCVKASASSPRWLITATSGTMRTSPATARRKLACAPSE